MALVCGIAHAGADDIVFTKRNSLDLGQAPFVPLHNTSGLGTLIYDSASPSTSPQWTVIGSGIFYSIPTSGNAAAGELVIGSDSRLSDARTPTAHTQLANTISDSTTVGRSVLTASDATAARTAIGAGTSSFVPSGSAAQYLDGTGAPKSFPAGGSGTVTSIGVSSTNLTVSGSPVTTSGTIAVSLPNVGTADTYSGVTTDAQGRVTAGTKRSVSFLTKALNTCTQVSASRDADVLYNAEITASAALVGGQRGTLYLETFTDSACTLNVQEVMRSTNGNTSALIVAVGNVSTTTLTVQGPVAAGLYVKVRTENNTATPTFTARPGWEKLN